MKDLAILLLAALTIDAFTIARADRSQHPPMDAKTQAAFEACATENNLPKLGSGTRPTQAQREALHACLENKGIQPPARRFGHRHDENQESEQQAPPSQNSSGSSSSSGGGAQ